MTFKNKRSGYLVYSRKRRNKKNYEIDLNSQNETVQLSKIFCCEESTNSSEIKYSNIKIKKEENQ